MSGGTARHPPRAATILAVALLVAGPPLEYLRYHRYPLGAPEVLVPLGLWLLVAAAFGLVLNRAPRVIRVAGFTPLILVFLDWQFSDHVDVPFKLAAIGVVVAAWLLDRHLETLVVIMLAVFYATMLPTSSRSAAADREFPAVAHDTSLAPVVYLILDEHIGVAGLPPELAPTRALAEQLRRFYLARGFRLFGDAYSEYVETRSSIPAVLNWTEADPARVTTEVVPDARYRLTSNALFRRLGAAGYRIRVYESSYLEFCETPGERLASCVTRPGNSIRNLSLHHLPLWPKARLVGLYFLEHNSHLYGLLRRHFAARYPGSAWQTRMTKAGFLAAIELLDRLQADIQHDDPRGTVYFAHLLAPHHPYEVDASCRSQPHPSRWLEIEETRTAADRAERYELYAPQVECLYRHLDTLMQAIDRRPDGARFVIVVHGDHGSRITIHYPLASHASALDRTDLADGFATLFAVRAPAVPPGYDTSFVPIRELAGRLAESGFAHLDLRAAAGQPLRLEEFAFGKPHLPYRVSAAAMFGAGVAAGRPAR